jgi:hypothetical protein
MVYSWFGDETHSVRWTIVSLLLYCTFFVRFFPPHCIYLGDCIFLLQINALNEFTIPKPAVPHIIAHVKNVMS